MEKFVKIKLENGKEITCMESELSGLRKSGLLKEGKEPSETKEFKDKAETKARKEKAEAKKLQDKKIHDDNAKYNTGKPRPVNIGAHSIKK